MPCKISINKGSVMIIFLNVQENRMTNVKEQVKDNVYMIYKLQVVVGLMEHIYQNSLQFYTLQISILRIYRKKISG